MAEVVLRKVEKSYSNGFRAVHGIDLTIAEGEFMVFVGPSGCAKSTTLRMIAGLEEVSGGDIFIGNQRVNALPPKDRGIAMVFQNYALYPHMSAYDNMAFGLKQQKLAGGEIDRRIREAAETLELSQLLDNKPGEMSGGQRQRVALGRAMVRKPDVFLFDEPLSNLDAKLRVSTRVNIARLHKTLKAEGQNATMIYVTHDQVEAMTLGDRICVLNQGRIMQVDTPINLYQRPANKFVAGFIGSPAMNLVTATLERTEKSHELVLGHGERLRLPEAKASQVAHLAGRQLWFGLRPEHITLADASGATPNQPNLVNASITAVESMGNESYLHFSMGEASFVARVPYHSHAGLPGGERKTLCFDLAHCHLFDIDTEQSLLREE
ncbi:sn-glycerol-3-phosphate ABC transporter ATP-binding protein UgpC [Oceanimonas sp. NS1]|nr:sn-glycerol-3-phosphate ABC transporter ATP-binding protein UgpC [Oceanimonas sp. NS1]